MDGKQARRTHSASPLGLLFDHGVDLWAIPFMNVINCYTCFGMGESFLMALAVMVSFAAIFFLNVEQYYTKVLRLGSFDANADGIHTFAVIMGITATFGTL